MKLTDKYRRMGVRANADTPEQAEQALALGAEGIGLCRTEHMFLGSDRVQFVRDMILAEDEVARDLALAKLLPMQRKDFVGIFKAMESKKVKGLYFAGELLDLCGVTGGFNLQCAFSTGHVYEINASAR